MANHPSIDTQIQNATGDQIRLLFIDHWQNQISLTDRQIRAAVMRLIKVGKAFDILTLLHDHSIQRIELTHEEIRATVAKIIEIGDAYDLLNLLQHHSAQRIELTHEEIRNGVRKIIKIGDAYDLLNLLEAHIDKEIELTHEEIRNGVRKIIKIGDAYDLLNLLEAHIDKEIELTHEEIRDAVRKIIEVADAHWIGKLLDRYFPKLTERQINLITKETAPVKMKQFLRIGFEKLDLNQFQRLVKATHPSHIRLPWKDSIIRSQLSQEKLIIVEERLVNVERRKMIVTLKLVSKLSYEVALVLQQLPWRDLRFLCYDQESGFLQKISDASVSIRKWMFS